MFDPDVFVFAYQDIYELVGPSFKFSVSDHFPTKTFT
jgi:hypothetical protein